MSDDAIAKLQRDVRRTRTARSEWTGGMARRAYADLGTLTASNGSIIFVTDGLKSGESTGNGSGVPAYFSGDTWYRFSDDTAVQT